MAITCQLRDFRKKHGVGFTELMRATGIATSTLSRMELNKNSGVDYATMSKLIAYFRQQEIACEVGDLLVYVEDDSALNSTFRT